MKRNWPIREKLVVGEQNVIEEQLVSRDKIIFPPLHIKLGLMKQLVKALDKDGDCFAYVCKSFPGLSTEKFKGGIFVGPQIRRLINDTTKFEKSMTDIERITWRSFVMVVRNFLGNKKDKDYVELVESLLKNLRDLGANMSIKVHFLQSHLDRFPENCGDVSDEQGERFHQDLKKMEERYQGRWDAHMIADYCWGLQRDDQNIKHSRKSRKRSLLQA